MVLPAGEGGGDFFVDNLLVRIHLIIVMIRWTGLAPGEFDFPFSGSLTSTFLYLDYSQVEVDILDSWYKFVNFRRKCYDEPFSSVSTKLLIRCSGYAASVGSSVVLFGARYAFTN